MQLEPTGNYSGFAFSYLFYGYLLSMKSDAFTPIYDNDKVSTSKTF